MYDELKNYNWIKVKVESIVLYANICTLSTF
jgi:hypothetical protein